MTSSPPPVRRSVAALVLIVVFVLADLGFAQVGKAMVPGWELRAHRLKFRISDPVFHHGLAASVTQVDRWGDIGYPLFTNSLGLRDARVREVALVPEGRRIAFIGDSFTEGVGFPWEQTFVGRVAAALEPQGIEVLNLGVSSYSPVIYFKKVEQLVERQGLRFDELVVFVDTGDVYNEARWYEQTPDGRIVAHVADGVNVAKQRSRLGDWLAVNSLTGKLLYTLADRWRYERSKRLISAAQRTGGPDSTNAMAVNAKDASWTWDEAAWAEWGQLGLQRALANMDRLEAITRAHGIRLTVAIYPWPGQVWRGQVENREVTVFSAWAAAHGAGFLNLYPELIKDGPEADLKAHYIPGDVHWNADGHALVADRVLRYLAQRDGGR